MFGFENGSGTRGNLHTTVHYKADEKVQTMTKKKADDAYFGSNHTFCDSEVEGEKADTPRSCPGDALTRRLVELNAIV